MLARWVVFATLLTATPAAFAAYTGGDVVGGGTIKGTVKLAGVAPKPESYRITKDTEACGNTKTLDDVVVGPGNALKNVVVSIEGIAQGKKAPPPAALSVDQQICVFVPRVQAAVVNSKVLFLNSDAILHNIHAYNAKLTVFNVAMPVKGLKLEKKLAKPGIHDFQCDAGHTWMRACIHVFEHPYFAVTGDDGAFSLTDVPPGKHKLVFWHERFGRIEKQVEVPPRGEVGADAEFVAR